MSTIAGSLFGSSIASLIDQARSWIKPLLTSGPLWWLFAYGKTREETALSTIDEKFSSDKSAKEINQQLSDLEKQGTYQFIKGKGEGPQPLVVLALGTRQNDFNNKEEVGLLEIAEHLSKKHPHAHVLILKAPDASKAVQHLFCLSDDASANTDVRTKENCKIIENLEKGFGIQISGVCPVGFSWGAGMLCEMRKQDVFGKLKVPVLGTVTIDAIKPGVNNMGEAVTELGCNKEPNLHIYQKGTYYGLNGACPRDLGDGDKAIELSETDHSEIDNDTRTKSEVCKFLDGILSKEFTKPEKNQPKNSKTLTSA